MGLSKIVIIGPESTGKSSLCEQLAKHYNTVWCPEYAREYLLMHGASYNYDDLLSIAKGQIDQEDQFISRLPAPGSSMFFIDTDMYVMKIWSEFVFEKCHRFILEQIVERKYDLYLLCNIDLPWIADELREYPDMKTRQRLYKIYKDNMVNQSIPWVEISGDYEQRFKLAVGAVERFILQP